MFKNVKKEGLLKCFYTYKTIQPKNKFIVDIYDNLDSNGVKKRLYDNIGYMPNINPWHIQGVSFPTSNNISKEDWLFGYSIPTVKIFDQIKSFKLDFEEDENQTIHKFITWLNRKIISSNGLHRSQIETRVSGIRIYILDNYYAIRREILIENFFLSEATSELALAYTDNTSVIYSINFSCSNVKIIIGNEGKHVFDLVKQ